MLDLRSQTPKSNLDNIASTPPKLRFSYRQLMEAMTVDPKFFRPPLMLNYHQPSSTVGCLLLSGPPNFSNLKLWDARNFELTTSNVGGYAHPIHQPVFRSTDRCSTHVPVTDLKIITTQTKQCLSSTPLLRRPWPVIDRRTIYRGALLL